MYLSVLILDLGGGLGCLLGLLGSHGRTGAKWDKHVCELGRLVDDVWLDMGGLGLGNDDTACDVQLTHHVLHCDSIFIAMQGKKAAGMNAHHIAAAWQTRQEETQTDARSRRARGSERGLKGNGDERAMVSIFISPSQA